MNIVICNERLLPRFGVDRLLLMLARHMVSRGHRVTLYSVRCDRAVAERITPHVRTIDLPPDADMFGIDRAASNSLERLVTGLNVSWRPDVVVTGGWPFFATGELAYSRGIATVFIDAGAVPNEEFTHEARRIQMELRRIRALALPAFSHVMPISRFIAETQTIPDRGHDGGVTPVLLGADHLEQPLFAANAEPNDEGARALLRRAQAGDEMLVLALGRFESDGYKNSAAVFDVFRAARQARPTSRLVLLARPGDAAVPADLADSVEFVGFIGDAVLQEVMRASVLGLSTSLWEGFNLPLAEMQWLARPVLVFNIGAHPEVVVDPWFLCGNVGEMQDKAQRIVREGPPAPSASSERYLTFRERFQWDRVLGAWARIIESFAPPRRAFAVTGPAVLPLLIDVTCASADSANSGVVRVTRQLGAHLAANPALLCLFTYWDRAADTYRPLDAHRRGLLRGFGGPRDGALALTYGVTSDLEARLERLLFRDAIAQPILLLPEVVLDGGLAARLAWARSRSMPTAAILYDLIPVTHRPYCSHDVVQAFPDYLEGITCCDSVFAISQTTLHDFMTYAARHHLPRPHQAETVWLPGQFGAETRARSPRSIDPHGPIRIVCVSTLEPRKNHRTLIRAFRRLRAERPELDLRLTLIGNSYAGADDLADWVVGTAAEEPRLSWLGSRPDTEVAGIVGGAAFTVYPSLVEGFGLPILESLWLGTPVLCHEAGVMAELAAGGGCLVADMSDEASVATSIAQLASDHDLRAQLATEATARSIADWRAYAVQIASGLHHLSSIGRVT